MLSECQAWDLISAAQLQRLCSWSLNGAAPLQASHWEKSTKGSTATHEWARPLHAVCAVQVNFLTEFLFCCFWSSVFLIEWIPTVMHLSSYFMESPGCVNKMQPKYEIIIKGTMIVSHCSLFLPVSARSLHGHMQSSCIFLRTLRGWQGRGQGGFTLSQ